MLFAPHPDDESLACGVVLQRAARGGAAIRVIYATDGEDNPWPQRVLEGKWRLSAADRKRWGRLRRAEALAALVVLGVPASTAAFLGLPDQKLTALLVGDPERRCKPRPFQRLDSVLDIFAASIADWRPTDILVPSISDTHPDHSALAVMLRLVMSESFSAPGVTGQPTVWSYVVHGRTPAFLDRATPLKQSHSEAATKLRAIRCHKTQLKLSRKRFLGYAHQPERLVKIGAWESIVADGSIDSVSRMNQSLRVKVRLSPKAMAVCQPMLFVLGRDEADTWRCFTIGLPARSSALRLRDSVSMNGVAVAHYLGNAFVGQLVIPTSVFSPGHPIFVKLERRSLFFDEAGWLEVPPAPCARIAAPERDRFAADTPAIR
jgi:LmbE family N-acetylglucosaminyl deacetylase